MNVYMRKRPGTGVISQLCFNHRQCGQVGSHVMELLDHDTYLCRKCSKAWKEAYESAVHPSSWERALCRKEVV